MLLLQILCAALIAAGPADDEQGKNGGDYDTFSVSRLTCAIGNNSATTRTGSDITASSA